MEIKTAEIARGSSWVGKVLWICDYRRPDLDKKPIRHVPPTKVILLSNENLPANKRIYYSENHFVKLNSKGMPSSTIIPLFDNTGYRSNTGTPLNVFDNEQECIDCYNKQADEIIKALDEKISSVVQCLKVEREEVVKQKMTY